MSHIISLAYCSLLESLKHIRMDNIISYFNGERIQCIIGLIISLIFISASVYFLFQAKSFLKGFAYTAIPLSMLLITICAGVILRTPSDIKRVTTIATSPDKIKTEEIPRMNKVMRNFAIIKKVEIGIAVLGVILILVFKNNDLIRGVATALIIEGLILLLFDHIAELRGHSYLDLLTSNLFKD